MADQTPDDKLQKAIGISLRTLVKQPGPSAEIFKKVLAKRDEEKQKKAEAKAEEQINKLAELQEQADKVDTEYKKARKKLDEEIGKAVNQVTNSVNGGQPQAENATADAPQTPTPTGTTGA